MRNIENERKQQFWLQKEEERKVSGITRKEYCRQNNLSYDQFSYWVRKSEKMISSSTTNSTFVNITHEINSSYSGNFDRITIMIGDKIKLETPVHILKEILPQMVNLS